MAHISFMLSPIIIRPAQASQYYKSTTRGILLWNTIFSLKFLFPLFSSLSTHDHAMKLEALLAPSFCPFQDSLHHINIQFYHININFCVCRLILRDEVSGDVAGLLRLYRSILNGLMLLPLSSLAKAATKQTTLVGLFDLPGLHIQLYMLLLGSASLTLPFTARHELGFAGDWPLPGPRRLSRGRDPLPASWEQR